MKVNTVKLIIISPLLLIILGISCLSTKPYFSDMNERKVFSGTNALVFAAQQVNFGPRSYQSYAHNQAIDLISTSLERFSWNIEIQTGKPGDRIITNIIAKNSPYPPNILVGVHYDSRMFADQDPDNRKVLSAVPGANDGASGVAVLLELSRILQTVDIPIWLVFFDAEDDGNIHNQEWSMGSKYFVSQLKIKPNSVIILDMIGDKELDIYREINSNEKLTKELWNTAEELGYSSSFINRNKYSMIDDHIPFLQMGIPAVLLIDFDYPYWHTTSDTLDKISSSSLQKVGSTIHNWILSQQHIVE